MQKTIYGMMIWIIATLFVVYTFSLNTIGVILAADMVKSALHASDIGVCAAAGAFILGFACTEIPAGYLLDKFNARFVVSTGILILVIGNIAISISSNLVVFTLSNFLQGIGGAFAFVASAVLISQWFSAHVFPVLFGLTQTLSCALTGVFHYSFILSLKTYTWNELYQALAVFGFVLFIACLLFVRTPRDYKQEERMSLKQSLRIVLKNKQIWLAAFAAATSLGALLAYASFWYLKVQVFYWVKNLEAAVISGMIFLGIGIGTPILGWVSNKVRSRTAVVHVSLVLGVMGLLLAIYLPHYNIETLIIIKIVSFLTGFFLSGSMLFYTVVSEVASNKTRGVAISFLNTTVFLFNTLMLFVPLLFVTTLSKEFFTYLWILPFCVMISILLVYFIKDTYQG